MNDAVQVLVQYGYVVLFAFALAEQIGLPIPAVPALLGVGALAGVGRMSLALALGVVLAASLPPDGQVLPTGHGQPQRGGVRT
jgi:membrane protein DedA with SNARE-associated domain